MRTEMDYLVRGNFYCGELARDPRAGEHRRFLVLKECDLEGFGFPEL